MGAISTGMKEIQETPQSQYHLDGVILQDSLLGHANPSGNPESRKCVQTASWFLDGRAVHGFT